MVTFRLANPADRAAVMTLLEEIMQLHGVPVPPEERLTSVLEAILAESAAQAPSPAGTPSGRHHSILVAEQDGCLLGMCAVIFSLSTWSAAPVCEVQDLIVTRRHRRNEIGRGLIEMAERLAREHGCARLFLLTESWNLGAHAFYRSLGLTEKTCLYFERALEPPDS